MDEFANVVTDCIRKGVLYYTNLPTGGVGSPNNKCKGVGERPMAST